MNNMCEKCDHTGCITTVKGDKAWADLCSCVKSCPDCGGSGWVSVEKGGYTFSDRCGTCGPYRQACTWYNEANIPARFAGARFVDFEDHLSNHGEVLGYAVHFADCFDPETTTGLMLMGPVGTGKTFLVSAILRHLILVRRVRGRFVDFFHLLSDLKRGFSAGRSESALIDPLASVPVLVIDELGKGREEKSKQDWELQVLDQIISRRYNAKLPTLITSNYIPSELARMATGCKDKDQEHYPLLFDNTTDLESIIFEGISMEERIGSRIYSRLREMCEPIILYGKDYRCRDLKDE